VAGAELSDALALVRGNAYCGNSSSTPSESRPSVTRYDLGALPRVSHHLGRLGLILDESSGINFEIFVCVVTNLQAILAGR